MCKTVCFSGHRPEKLFHGGDEAYAGTNRLKSIIYKEIYDSYAQGYTNFMSGLARGIDIWAAEMVVDFKHIHPEVRLIGVKPYRNHGETFKGTEKWRFNHIIESCDDIIVISETYNKGCMRARNEYMVEHSSKLIAVVSDFQSGTGQTINLARKKGLDIKIINLNNNTAFF